MSTASLASHGGLRREVSDEDVAAFAKSVALPRYGPAKARRLGNSPARILMLWLADLQSIISRHQGHGELYCWEVDRFFDSLSDYVNWLASSRTGQGVNARREVFRALMYKCAFGSCWQQGRAGRGVLAFFQSSFACGLAAGFTRVCPGKRLLLRHDGVRPGQHQEPVMGLPTG